MLAHLPLEEERFAAVATGELLPLVVHLVRVQVVLRLERIAAQFADVRASVRVSQPVLSEAEFTHRFATVFTHDFVVAMHPIHVYFQHFCGR